MMKRQRPSDSETFSHGPTLFEDPREDPEDTVALPSLAVAERN